MNSGAQANVAIKSGTNQYHGVAFEFLRNDLLDARGFFLSPTQPKNKLRRNQFGGLFSGPIRKDKTLPSGVLSSGSHGKNVRVLQSFLVTHGYLVLKDITGSFCARTESALLKYQLDRKIIASPASHGAGVFGPATKAAAIDDLVAAKWQSVRANGDGTL